MTQIVSPKFTNGSRILSYAACPSLWRNIPFLKAIFAADVTGLPEFVLAVMSEGFRAILCSHIRYVLLRF